MKMGAHRVPISPKGIRGPEGARIKKLITKWNRAKYVEPSEICGTERIVEMGAPIGVPICPQGIEVHEV